MEQYYLRIDREKFYFVVEGIHDIKNTDISQGKQFKLKEIPTGNTLFDYIEEYTSEPGLPSPPTKLELLQEEVLEQSEYMVEMDYRLLNLELGL